VAESRKTALREWNAEADIAVDLVERQFSIRYEPEVPVKVREWGGSALAIIG
jgi:hypothetical protein